MIGSKKAKASGPLARATSHAAIRNVPKYIAMPVNRCVIDANMVA